MTDLRGVDLARTPFDFDLTFAALLMHPDGHVYHRYGGRDERGADVWLSEASLERVLQQTLVEHEAYRAAPVPPERRPALRLEEVPAFKRRDKGDCIHCHSVFPALYEERRAAGLWKEDERWVYPPPGRVGLDLAQDEQTRVTLVRADSPASAAGLRVGDRLLRANGRTLATASDLSYWLHELAPEGGALTLEVQRNGVADTLALPLDPGWKRGTPLEFAWRPFKWGFTPEPGFGGAQLTPEELRTLALAPDAFAFRVTYLVTWGENARYGAEAERAGLRQGDVFLAAAGERAFASVDHFHAWWRLTRTTGEKVTVDVLRDGERRALELDVLP